VESGPGEGSAFSLIIPLLPEESLPFAAGPGDYRKERAGSGLFLSGACEDTVISEEKDSILLVEDNPDMAAILRSLLETRYNLHWCGGGQETLEYLNSNPPVALIICDVMMPGMSGFSLREKIISRGDYKDTPFVFLTALADPGDKVLGLETGALDYIQKPFSSSELLLKIQNLLETHKASYRQALRDREGIERLHRLATPKEPLGTPVQWDGLGITPAEKRVLELLRQGFQDKEIASKLSLSPRTISSHLGNLYRKTDTQNRIELLNRLYPNP
jgi:DNA-binding NarL/FixJ family response regulator